LRETLRVEAPKEGAEASGSLASP